VLDSQVRPWCRRGTRRRATVPARAPPVFPRSDLERPNQIQRPGLEDTGSAGNFAKESLEILNIEPVVQGIFPNCVFFFVKRILIAVTLEIRFHLFIVLPFHA
jgi:hypothetical protein